ncbi:hypothetical protein [Acetobacter thailandicus]|nr:hypothetical protein [Acetobacter thailandicus]
MIFPPDALIPPQRHRKGVRPATGTAPSVPLGAPAGRGRYRLG